MAQDVAVVGRSFRVCGPGQGVYTMAANAVLDLILRFDVDPRETILQLAVGRDLMCEVLFSRSRDDLDLAGSDRIVELHGDRSSKQRSFLREGGNVINLTRLLQDAFGNAPDGEAGNERIGTWGAGETAVYVESASYIKFREIALSYDVPQSVVRSLWSQVKRARLSLSARNLFWLHTPYKGFDPEVSNFGNQPIARNIDVTPYPPSRSFFFTIYLGL